VLDIRNYVDRTASKEGYQMTLCATNNVQLNLRRGQKSSGVKETKKGDGDGREER
jgi:hypothetical protein